MTDRDPGAAPTGVPSEVAATYRPADRYGFLDRDRAHLRYACWNAQGTPAATRRGTILLLTGRGEFIEKYASEVVGELLDRGFAVIALDWRGQGLSYRPLADREKGHIDSFDTYLADLKLFLQSVVASEAPRPILALCHSMGGHILLRHLAETGAEPLSAGLIVSPMTALQREAFLRSVLMLMPEMAVVDHRYLFGTGPFVFLAREFASNHVTHDERRYRFTEAWFNADPRLSLAGPTIGWAVMLARVRTGWRLVQVLGSCCLLIVVATRFAERFDWFAGLGWGRPDSFGHYLDLCSAILGLIFLPLGYALARRRKSRRGRA